MVVEHSASGGQDERLYAVLLEYLEFVEQGGAPDQAEFLSRHPEFGPELKEFLEAHHHLEDLTAPLRWDAPTLLNAASPSRGAESALPADKPVDALHSAP